jgi:hypothetical protein
MWLSQWYPPLGFQTLDLPLQILGQGAPGPPTVQYTVIADDKSRRFLSYLRLYSHISTGLAP